MAHGAHPDSRATFPRADIALARDCEECRGWGTVITTEGHHELCPACQHPTNPPTPPQRPAPPEG